MNVKYAMRYYHDLIINFKLPQCISHCCYCLCVTKTQTCYFIQNTDKRDNALPDFILVTNIYNTLHILASVAYDTY